MGLGKKIGLFSIIVILALIVGVCLKVWVFNSESSNSKNSRFISNSPLGVYEKAAVAAHGPECSQIGVDMLKRNGSAVDAAIAALLCEGVASLHSMGLGGGFFMTIYDAKSNKSEYLDARETAPNDATEDMFHGNASLSYSGGLAVAVPGELRGYVAAHRKYGKLPWKILFEPAIELCKTGNIVTKYLEKSLWGKESWIMKEPTLMEILIDPKTNKIYREGDRIKRPQLAKTLERLAEDREKAEELFYNGEIADDLVREIKDFGGIVTKEDFSEYKVNWMEPLSVKLGNKTLYTAPAPGSGAILAFILNVLQDLASVKDERVLWQRIVETFKWAYAKRTELGDPAFVDIKNVLEQLLSNKYAKEVQQAIRDDKTYNDPRHYGVNSSNVEDHGTSHVSVLAPDGSAVSVTSTINQVLGAKIRSNSTGILFNDEMDDFSNPGMSNAFDLPASPNNYIRAKKRPLSSMAPTIVLGEDGKVELVVGAAGGTKITSAVAVIMVLNFWRDYDIKEATDAYRLHHQLFPMEIKKEKNFPTDILDYLWGAGHKITTYSGIGSAVTIVSNKNGRVTANSDWRREGTTAGF